MTQDIHPVKGVSEPQAVPAQPAYRPVDQELLKSSSSVNEAAKTGLQDNRHAGLKAGDRISSQNEHRPFRQPGSELKSDANQTRPSSSQLNRVQCDLQAAEQARQTANKQAALEERLRTKAALQARLRFMNKNAEVAFKTKSGIVFHFDRQALEKLVDRLNSRAKTIDIGGHDIPLGIFDNGIFSFAELDQTRVENGLTPLFSAASN